MQVRGRTIVIGVSIVAVLSFATGWWFTSGVRARAKQVDAELSLVAGALQAYAKVHDGELPTSQDMLLAGLPADFKGAAELTAALKDVQVRWPPSSDLAPVLQSNGLPSGFGTLARLNEQLHDLQKRRP
jgi:type II secretory pathway pseudopilin PulG